MATSSSYELVHQAKSEVDKPHSTEPTERPWQPGMLKQLPWTGLLALLLGFSCGVAALTIALVSEGKPLDYWRVQSYSVQPTVLLAILVTLANVLIGYAFASGIAIFWWSSALAGSTLRRLHASQSRGDSLMAVLTLRPIFNAVTIASVFTILLLTDQPMFQRGIRVVSRSSKESRNTSIPISSSPVQLGATGIIPDHSSDERPELFHPLYAQVVRQYQNRDPIQFALPDCKGRRCDLEVISTGWEVSCIKWETPYQMMTYPDFELWSQWLPINETEYKGPPRTQPTFSVNITYLQGTGDWQDEPFYGFRSFHIDTSVMYKATPGASGIMRWQNCTLTEALIRYPVEVSNDTLTLKPMSPDNNRTVQRVFRSTEVTGQFDHPSTFGGIWRAIENQFAAQANVTFVAFWTSIRTQDVAANTYLQASSNGTLDSINYTSTWSDPTEDMISMAHELTLRTAIATTEMLVVTSLNDDKLDTTPTLLTQYQADIGSPNLTLVNRTVSQKVEVMITSEETVYETQPEWLAGAFAVIVIACLSIVPTYWGWWRLGRPVSMSPLEIAKAFDAPLMQQADPNGSVADHLRAVGDTKVRYGYLATVAEPRESDAIERLSYQPITDNTLSNPVIEQGSSSNSEPNRHSSESGSALKTPIIGLARPDDDIELQMLQPEANSTSGTRLDPRAARRSFVSSDPSESVPEIQADSSSGRAPGIGPASSRIHTRIEMRLKFAEER